MLELNKELPKTKTRIERLIAATDSEIDRLVYELYGLNAEDIKLVEGGASEKLKQEGRGVGSKRKVNFPEQPPDNHFFS